MEKKEGPGKRGGSGPAVVRKKEADESVRRRPERPGKGQDIQWKSDLKRPHHSWVQQHRSALYKQVQGPAAATAQLTMAQATTIQ